MPKVLLTGASGLLGRAILKELKTCSQWDVLGLSFSRTTDDLMKCDLTQHEQVQDVLTKFRPNIVIHAAAERRPDVVEGQKDTTKNLNVTATEDLCKIAASMNASVLYISTDYVFDGDNPPYKEDATPNPLNYYGQTKLEGEQATLNVDQGNMVLRVPILYGEVEFVKESAVTILLESVKNSSKESKQDDYARRFPTHVADIAYVIRQMLDKKIENPALGGIFHWSGKECFTKYGMCKAMCEVFNLQNAHIASVKTPPQGSAKRPYDANLHRGKLEGLIDPVDTPFSKGIKQCLQPYL